MIVKLIFGGVLILSLAGGIDGFSRTFSLLLSLILWLVAAAAAAGVIVGLIYFLRRRHREKATLEIRTVGPASANSHAAYRGSPASTTPSPPREPLWTIGKIRESLGEIDWYQFEKFCAALLRSEGYDVERKGGAQPDGGVDLVAIKNGESMLVQCKHWRTWTVQEKVIRELLGSMTHFKVNRGALYTLKGWTPPAGAFAAEHGIILADASSLASRALTQLPADYLSELLTGRHHHCPKCESPMVRRTGNFEPFWGCSTFPRCRQTLKYSGAR